MAKKRRSPSPRIPSKKNFHVDSEGVTEFYKNQKELLEKFEEDQKTIRSPEKAKEEDEKSEDRFLAQAVFALNIASLIGNLVASVVSGSLSIMSTFVDSSMDIATNIHVAAIDLS
ncbi:unnamed protein product [Caenorhabditis angaria]|uniref:Uncharacterized protein n=1 Tax=Caenorhabditis angaria TaxID=860376 RepID=A0A9P1MVJ3_9PELO|nr:unnamed protein product [Caenorhabditis angaria]